MVVIYYRCLWRKLNLLEMVVIYYRCLWRKLNLLEMVVVILQMFVEKVKPT